MIVQYHQSLFVLLHNYRTDELARAVDELRPSGNDFKLTGQQEVIT